MHPWVYTDTQLILHFSPIEICISTNVGVKCLSCHCCGTCVPWTAVMTLHFLLQTTFLWQQLVSPPRLAYDLHITVCGWRWSPPISSCRNCISWWYMRVQGAQQPAYPVWRHWLLASPTSCLSIHPCVIPQLQLFPKVHGNLEFISMKWSLTKHFFQGTSVKLENISQIIGRKPSFLPFLLRSLLHRNVYLRKAKTLPPKWLSEQKVKGNLKGWSELQDLFFASASILNQQVEEEPVALAERRKMSAHSYFNIQRWVARLETQLHFHGGLGGASRRTADPLAALTPGLVLAVSWLHSF